MQPAPVYCGSRRFIATGADGITTSSAAESGPMRVSREDAIRLATTFANTNGYRVVPSFDGVPWAADPLPVKLDAARLIDGEWAVLFDKLLHPEVLAECPGNICVVVPAGGEACRFYPML
jgi:hypothetical protein